MVETAMVITVLIVLAICLIQFGLIVNTKIQLSNVSRQVSRYAAVTATQANAESLIKNYAVRTATGVGLKITTDDVKVGTTPGATYTAGQDLPITINCDMSNKIFLPNGLLGVVFVNKITTSKTTVLVQGTT